MARPSQTHEEFLAKQQQVLDAATRVLETDGSVEGITLRAMAKVLNWSYSTAYRYFASKEELLIALRTRAYHWMTNELNDAINSRQSNSINLERLTHAYINAGLRRPSMYQLMFLQVNLTERDNELLRALNQAKTECLNVCTQAMIEAQENGELSGDTDPLTAAHIFWVSAHGTVALQLAEQLVMGRDIQEITHALLNVVLIGLQSTRSTSDYFQHNSLHDHPVSNIGVQQ